MKYADAKLNAPALRRWRFRWPATVAVRLSMMRFWSGINSSPANQLPLAESALTGGRLLYEVTLRGCLISSLSLRGGVRVGAYPWLLRNDGYS